MDFINLFENSVRSGYDYEDKFSGERDESTAVYRYIATILQGLTSTAVYRYIPTILQGVTSTV